jgi:hypothetical protein
MPTTTAPPRSTEAPSGPHVMIYPSGDRSPVAAADTWHIYRARYGESYPWDHATPEEAAIARAHDEYYATHGCYPA